MKPSLPGGAWIAAGLVVAAIIAPGVSYAAGTLTEIVGLNGTTAANVTAAHQLLTATATPASAVVLSGSASLESSACVAMRMPVTGKAIVLRDIRTSVQSGTSPDILFISVDPTTCGTPFANFALGGVVNDEIRFDPGIPVPAGDKVWIQLANSSGTEESFFMDADGYVVPNGDVPAGPSVASAR